MSDERQRRIDELAERVNAARTDVAALDELAILLRADQQWSMLRDVLALRAEVESAPVERARWLVERARIEEDELGDLEAAVRTYEEVIALAPETSGAQAALARLRAFAG